MKKIVLLFLLVISMQLWGKEINGNYSNFLYYEDAVKSGSEVRITPDEGGKVGAVWSRNIFDLNEDFHFEYEIYLGTKGIKKKPSDLNMEPQYIDDDGNVDIGADGMAFAFKSSDYKNVNYGEAGQYIGYDNYGSPKRFEKSFGVKFDTYTNPGYDPKFLKEDGGRDLTKDHIAFIARGKIGTIAGSSFSGNDFYQAIPEMEDGEWHKVTFDWDASSKTFKYTFRDGIKTYTDTYSGDIVQEYLGGRYAYFGFTSSTGQWMNEHKFRNPIIKGIIPTNDYKLDIKKEVVSGNNYKLGDTVKYKITITNPGSEDLIDIKLKDGIDISDNAGESDIELIQSTWDELKAGQSVVTYGTKKIPNIDKEESITQEDIDRGSIVRTAAVEAIKKGSDPKEYLYAAAEATVYANIVEGLEVIKKIDHIKDGEDYTKTKENYTKAGDVIVYEFSITNTGTQTLKDVSVSDLKVPGVQLDKTVLLPPKQGEENGEEAIGSGEYIVTQDDVDNGRVINTANFRAVKPDGNVIGKSATVTATGIPATYEFGASNTPIITDKDNSSVVKTYSKVGDIVTYTVTLENTGTGTLKDIKITDKDNTGGITLTDPTKTVLLPGEKAVGKITYTITQEDLDAGEILYPATFNAKDSKDVALTPKTEPATVKGTLAPSIEVHKTIAGTDTLKYSKAGDKITYNFSIKNTGNTTLTDVKVTDPKITEDILLTKKGESIASASLTLLPNEEAEGTGVYTVLQADVDTGKVDNTATFTGKDPSGTPVTEDDSVTAAGTAATYEFGASNTPVITDKDNSSVVKTYSKVGDIVTYTVTLENTGTGTLKDIKITDKDNTGGITLTDPTKTVLLPGEKAVGKITYTITQEDLDAGEILYPATFNAKDSKDVALTPKTEPATVKGTLAPSIEVHKTIAGTDTLKYSKAGDKITYNFSIKNTGNTTLTDVKVTDPKITEDILLTKKGESIASASLTLLPNEEAEGTGVYTVLQADVDTGKVDNTATFTGKDPSGTPVTEDDSVTAAGTAATYEFGASNTPVITDKDNSSVVKTYSKVGDIVTYTVTLENTGTGTLKDIKITDKDNTGGITLTDPTKTVLLPGEKAVGKITYTITQEDLDAGEILYPATFNAKDSKDVALTPKTEPATVKGTLAPSIEVHKTIAGTDTLKYSKAGDKITYNFSIKNTGNTTLTDVKVTDPKITEDILLTKKGESIASASLTLLPNEEAEGTGVYTVLQADVDTGKVDNTATFTGKDPSGTPVTEDDSVTAAGTAATYEFGASNTPVITDKDNSSVVKTYSKVGDIVTYTVTLENTGTGTLKDVVITDVENTGGITLIDPTKTVLLPGEKAVGKVTHTITQEDLDAGEILYPATFNAKDSKDVALTPKTEPATVKGTLAPSIEVHKTIAGTDTLKYSKAGDKITYNFSIKNTGNTTLTDVKVTDPKITEDILLTKKDESIASASLTLLPNEEAEGTGVYTVLQADVDTGKVDNTATFTGKDPSGTPVTEDDSVTAAGTAATYEFGASNTPVITDKDNSSVVKTYSKVGDIVTYTVTLENTGTGTLKDIKITDKDNTGGITLTDPTKTVLLPGEKAVGKVTYTITQEDLDAGEILYPATFNAKDSKDVALTPKTEPATVKGTLAPSIEVHKTIAGTDTLKYSKAGDKITYNFSIKNTGNTTLTDVKVTDPKITEDILLTKKGESIASASLTLLPNEEAEGTGVYTVLQADVDTGKVDNTATFTGKDPSGTPVTEDDSVTAAGTAATYEFGASNTPVITDKDNSSVVKTYSKVGDIVTYTVTLENTGTGTLKDVVITDVENTGGITLIDPTKTVLLPGEKAVGKVTHTITQEDLDAGEILYPATFNAKDSKDVALTPKTKPATVKGLFIVDLLIDKTVTDDNGSGKAEADERLKYTITIKNNSNITITDSKLIDTLASRFFYGQKPKNLEVKGTSYQGNLKTGMTLDSIPVGKSVEVTFEMTASYPADVLPGEKIDNTASITYGKESKNATAEIPVISISSLDLDIKLEVEDLGGDGFERGDGIVDDGEEAEYTISITNPTPVNAVNVLVSDDYKGLYLYKNNSYKYVSSDAKKLTGKDLKEGIILPEIKAGETIKLRFMVGFSYEGKSVDQDDTIPNEAYLSLQETSPLKKLRSSIAPINKSSNKVVLNVANPTYTLSKEIRDKKGEFYPGDIVVYDITLENTSAVIGKNIKIEDKVSEIKAFESWTWESGVSKTPESLLKTSLRKDLSENGIELLAGETKRYTVVGRLKDILSKGEVKNTVKAGENLELQAEATLKVEDAQIKVTKTAKKKWVSIGDLISYKITVQNLSGDKGTVLKNLSLKDMMPPGFKYAEGSGKVDGNDADEDLRGRTIYFNNLELIGDKKIEITYILRIGTGVKPGSYKNKAWIENISGKNLSNIGEASVEVINDPLFNSTVIIGKVFHDRDNDGWQDDANAYDIRVQTLSSQENYLDGSVKKGDEEWRISSESKELLLGNLDGRGDESEKSQKVILRRRIIDPKKIGDILIKSKEGSNITLKSTGEVIRNHSGNRNLTGVDLKVVRRVIKDPKYREELKDVKSVKKVRIENFIEPIYFDSAYAAIRDSENEKLKQYLEKLSNKKNLKLVIVGYTDSQRPSKRAKFKNNHELSIARANTLKDYLSMKLDLSEEMFVIDGKGPKNPKGSNRTSSGRQLNRRTEVVIEYDEEVMKQIPLKVDTSDYFEEVEIRNDGILEEGIPGVRLATVEGLVIETDQFGRYHVDGIDDIPDRGKNFIIKVDKVTLPSGTEFTTENPRVKTLTKVMEKFNFGVKIPKAKRRVKEKEIKVRVGSVFFLTDKWNVREDQIDNLKKISKLLTEYRGGVIVVEGNADSRASNKYNEILALKRAKSIGEELEKIMGKDMISNVKIVTDLSGGER